MKKEDIHLTDWKRILLGQAPLEFLIEVFIRTFIIYLFLILAMRIMGKRMTAQLSIYELSVVVMLGAIISIPMQIPDRGLLIGLFILLLTVVLHRILNVLSFKSAAIEKLTQGQSSILTKNGVLQLNAIKKASISRESLFANLRNKGITQLGQVQRVYLEGSGGLTLYKNKKEMAGLSILPDKDSKLKSSHHDFSKDLYSCISCGYTKHSLSLPVQKCPVCGNKHWTEAVNK